MPREEQKSGHAHEHGLGARRAPPLRGPHLRGARHGGEQPAEHTGAQLVPGNRGHPGALRARAVGFQGYSIFPELADTKVESSNPGFGLYTDFSFTFRTITPIPAGGSVQVTAPQDDFYFGPRLDTGETHDPLASIPPKSGKVTVRPPPKAVILCEVRLPDASLCPFGSWLAGSTRMRNCGWSR